MEPARSQLRINGIANIVCLMLMAFTLCLKQWAEVHDYRFSLREVYIDEFGGWTEMGAFKKMCTKNNIDKYSDIREDCKVIKNYEMGGILVRVNQYILFAVFAMSIQVYNSISSFATSFHLDLDIMELEFPHLLAPIAHSFAIILYLVTIDAAFTQFTPSSAFWLAILNILANYILSLHYKLNKNKIDRDSSLLEIEI